MLNIFTKISKGKNTISYTDDLFGKGDYDIDEILDSKDSDKDLVKIIINIMLCLITFLREKSVIK